MDKQVLRHELWQALREAGGARFPGVLGRVPNFKGAEKAAERLTELPAWLAARSIACNPDLPERPVRYLALKQGKRLYMSFPALAGQRPFVLVDPDGLPAASLWHASSMGGALETGLPVDAREMEPIGLFVAGCVGVASDGARIAKGGGYCDQAYALLVLAKKLSPAAQVATIAHSAQIVRRNRIPMESHDVPVDAFATPDALHICGTRRRRAKA